MKNFYITTPIYYVNSKPHVGGVYSTLMADIINRFQKLNGKNTRFLTGTDEHGQKIQQSAKEDNMNELEFVNKISQKFREIADYMNFNYNDFIRTTEQRHKSFIQDIWRKLVKNDWVYLGKYSGWYCVSDEAYYTEDELEKDKYGNYVTSLGKKVEWKEEESYFFRLSEFQNILLDIYKNTDFIQPDFRKNEVIAFVSGRGIKELEKNNSIDNYLKDLSISRNNFSWGIKVPCDVDGNELILDGEWINGIEENQKHVMYVWLDALFNYQSALQSVNKLDEFWANANVIHIVGKDILRFHTVYWPAFLIAVKFDRENLKIITLEDIISQNILPTTVFAHGWWTNEGKKISKSLGNAVSTKEEIKWLMGNFLINEEIAKDYLKYYLAIETQFGNDGDYSRIRLVEKINSELVNNIGNLIQRVLSMLYKNFGNKIDTIKLENDEKLERLLLEKTLNKFNFQEYKDLILDIATKANGYMEETAPWNLKKYGKINEMKDILQEELVYIIKITILLQPLCPFIASNIINYFNIKNRKYSTIYNRNIIEVGQISEPKAFFPRLVNL